MQNAAAKNTTQGNTRSEHLTSLGAGLLIALLGLSLPQPAQAGINLNLCERLVEDFFIPPVTREVLECDMSWTKCLFNPGCCVPGVCKTLPDCQLWDTIEVVAGYWKHAGEIHCDFTEISAEDLLEKWLRNELTNVTNIITGGIPAQLINYANADINIINDQGHAFPPHVQSILGEIVDPFYDNGHTGYAYHDISDVNIVSHRVFSASKYLTDDKAAITLGPVIVFRDTIYEQLMHPSNVYTLHDLKVGTASYDYVKAIETAAHELVHVKQYRELGRSTFLTNYILEFVFAGYGEDNFEREAYTFGAESSAHIGGRYCEHLQSFHNAHITSYGLDVPLLTCVEEYGAYDRLDLEVTHTEYNETREEFSTHTNQNIFLYVTNHALKALKTEEVQVRLDGRPYEARAYDHAGRPVSVEGHSLYGSDMAPLNEGHLVVTIPGGTFSHCEGLRVELVGGTRGPSTFFLREIGNSRVCTARAWVFVDPA